MIRYGQLVKTTKATQLHVDDHWTSTHAELATKYECKVSVHIYKYSSSDTESRYETKGYILPIGTVVMVDQVCIDSVREYIVVKAFLPKSLKVSPGTSLVIKDVDTLTATTPEEAAPYIEARNKIVARRSKDGLIAVERIDKLCS